MLAAGSALVRDKAAFSPGMLIANSMRGLILDRLYNKNPDGHKAFKTHQ